MCSPTSAYNSGNVPAPNSSLGEPHCWETGPSPEGQALSVYVGPTQTTLLVLLASTAQAGTVAGSAGD